MKPETCGFDITAFNTEVEKLSEEKIQEILDDWCCGWKYYENSWTWETYLITKAGVRRLEKPGNYYSDRKVYAMWHSIYEPVERICIKSGNGLRNITDVVGRKLREGMTVEDVKKLLVDALNRPRRIGFTDLREYSAKKTKFEFDGGKKWFTWIRCELPLLKRLSNKKFVEEHLNELMEYVYEDLRNDKKFKSYGVPVNILEPTNAVLTKAGTFVVMLQPKMLDEEER